MIGVKLALLNADLILTPCLESSMFNPVDHRPFLNMISVAPSLSACLNPFPLRSALESSKSRSVFTIRLTEAPSQALILFLADQTREVDYVGSNSHSERNFFSSPSS